MADASLTPQTTGTTGGFAFDSTKSPTDPAYVLSFVNYLATLPNADPQLKNDPNYYVQQIIANGGGVTQDNANYWQGHVTNPANYGGGGGGGGGAQDASSALWADPGFQARLQYGLSGIQNSAMAQGTGLSTGLMKDVSDYAGAQASQEFNNAFSRNMQLADLGYSATGQAANYNTGAASAGAAGTVGATNAVGGALTGVGNTATSYLLGNYFGGGS